VYWRKRYEEGRLVDGSSGNEEELLSRIGQLERMLRKLTIENQLSTKAVEFTAQRRKEIS
jgi:transposase-like protein